MGQLEQVEVHSLVVHEDARGWLVEVLRREQTGDVPFGQLYVTTAHPGRAKGNHYHLTKDEWFCVIQGQGRLRLQDIDSGEHRDLTLGEDHPVAVRIPPGVAHGIKNMGEGMMYLLAYTSAPYDPEAPDTYPQTVID